MIIRLHLHLRGGTSGDLFRLLGTTVTMLVHRLCVVTTKITECEDLRLRHLHLGPMIGLPTTHWMMVLRVILLVAMGLHLLVIYMIVMIDVPRLQVTGMWLTHQVHRQRGQEAPWAAVPFLEVVMNLTDFLLATIHLPQIHADVL